MKTNKMKWMLVVLLAMVGGGAWAGSRVVVAGLQNGSVKIGNVEATGDVTVTLTVTPADEYYITAADISVNKTAAEAMSRSGAPGYTDGISVAEGTVDDRGQGTYTFTLPDGYGAYVEATFTKRTALTAVTIDKEQLTYDTFGQQAQTVKVTSVKAGGEEVPADCYDVSGNTQSEVGSHTVIVTGKGHYMGTVTAQFSIVDELFEGDVVDTETGEKIPGTTIKVTVIDKVAKTIRIDRINVPEAAAGKQLTVPIATELNGYKVTEIAGDMIGSDMNVTDVIFADTEEPVSIGNNALPPTACIHTSLSLFEDYALMASLKPNLEAGKIQTVMTAPNKFWTFSSAIDCVIPETLAAYIVYLDDGTPRYQPIDESNLELGGGHRGIKAGNGVLLACTNGQGGDDYVIMAAPDCQQNGGKPATTDAKSYEGNQLEPVLTATNYQAGDCLVLKDNRFHSIKSNESKVKAGKAVLRINK